MPELKLTSPLPELDTARIRPGLRARPKRLQLVEAVDPSRARAHAQLARIGADPRLAGLKLIGDDEQSKT